MYSKSEGEAVSKNNVNKKWNPVPLIKGISITVLVLACAVLAAVFAYNLFMGQSTRDYRDSASALQTKIDKANSDFAAVLDKDTAQFPVDDVLKQLPATIDAFNSIIDKYNGIDPPSSYLSANKKLGDSIDLNKAIFTTLQTILQNPVDTGAQDNMKQLSDAVNQCMNGYTTIGIKNVNFSLPEEILSLPNKLDPFVSQKQSDNARVNSLIASYTQYFNSMSQLFESYTNARTDFNSIINNVRNNQAAWDDLFNKLDQSEDSLKDIKSSYSSLNVPSELSSLNKRFGPILDQSMLYIEKLRFAAQSEKNFNKDGLTQDQINQQTTQINNLYQLAEQENSNLTSNYQKFTSDMNAARDNYLDPNYVSSKVLSK